MRAAVVRAYGTVSVEDVPIPEPGEGEVLVRVRASSLNAVDWYGLHGRPVVARPMMGGVRRPKSGALGSDFAGVVAEVGSSVDDFGVGDEVYGTGDGTFAEYVIACKSVDHKPSSMSFEEAAAVPVAALTALQGLRDHAAVVPGQRVLVNGAAGGVGTFAVQLAKTLGGEVHAVCSTGNVEQAAELGADRVFDYEREDFTRSGVRYDVLFDTAGSRSWRAVSRVLDPAATVVLAGGPRKRRLFGPLPHIAAMAIAGKLSKKTVKFFVAKPNRADLAALRALIDEGKIRSLIDRTYDLAQIEDAMHRLDSGHARSKTVITM
ncbi:MAG: NAD(P)-dependent alcohol dehydrogenase [Gaiellaceae bacterium]